MITDVLTVTLKELRELFCLGGMLRGGKLSLLILLFTFGIFMPYQFGEEWLTSPGMLLYWAWVPLMIVAGAVADSFAGERERHTLETLLASRLPDSAILLGKFVAAVGYGWGLVLAMLGLGLVTVMALGGAEHATVMPWRMMAAVPLLALLGASIAAGAGILVSLRAATVRQASQALNVAILLIVFVPVFAVQALPVVWRAEIAVRVRQTGTDGLLWMAVPGMIAVACVLLAWALARFRRSRLILD